ENLNNFGLLALLRDPDQAEQAYREAAEILESASRSGDDPRWLASLTALLNNWGNLAARRGQTELAFRRFERGLSLVEDALRREPGETTLRYNALNLHGSRANLLGSLGRYGEAVADWDRVIALNDEPADRPAYRLLRALALVKSDGYARGVAEAEELARGHPPSSPPAGADLYNYACLFSRASAAARDDTRLGPAERRRLAESYAGAAMDWLRRTAAVGFFDDPMNREHARGDADLAPLQ